ncbi:MAG: aldo/keto reductase [Planctomycetes bacterium]|nr:aldo/keto reductase [Planctomycetota bacterium]
MRDGRITRRDFIRDGAVAAAGIAAAGTAAARGSEPDKAKILCYNENMEYRRLGKTEQWVSAVCLGGHWKRVDVMGQDFDENRREVVARCMDIGINYIDACCRGEVLAYTRALGANRSKVYLALSYCAKEVRDPQYRTARKLLENLDELLLESKQEYTDIWRITCLEPGGQHSFDTSCEMVEALEKAKKQGKARFIGMSSHDRRWHKMMIEYFPQIEVILFPYTAMTKKLPKDSLFDAVRARDIGVFGIKPFASNSIFKGDSSPSSPHAEDDDRRARLAIRCILENPSITAPIPGLVSTHQVDNMALAIQERRRELDQAERAELETMGREMWANLPEDYRWLRDWEFV